jgi:hypothetical protein
MYVKADVRCIGAAEWVVVCSLGAAGCVFCLVLVWTKPFFLSKHLAEDPLYVGLVFSFVMFVRP